MFAIHFCLLLLLWNVPASSFLSQLATTPKPVLKYGSPAQCSYDTHACGLSCKLDQCEQRCFGQKCYVICVNSSSCYQKCGLRTLDRSCVMLCKDTATCEQLCSGQQCDVSCRGDVRVCKQKIKMARNYKEDHVNKGSCTASELCEQRCEYQTCNLICDSPECVVIGSLALIMIEFGESVRIMRVVCDDVEIRHKFVKRGIYLVCGKTGDDPVIISVPGRKVNVSPTVYRQHTAVETKTTPTTMKAKTDRSNVTRRYTPQKSRSGHLFCLPYTLIPGILVCSFRIYGLFL